VALFAYKKLIHAEGYTVDACEELADALVQINTFSYFAVITDIRLSGSENTGGIDLLYALRTRQPDAKVIVITGYGDDEMKMTLAKLGSPHYFEKPVKPSLIIELLRSFRNMLDEQLEDVEFGISLPELSEAECL
jgi:DNA-binding NtrC family response regulator